MPDFFAAVGGDLSGVVVIRAVGVMQCAFPPRQWG